MGQMLSAPVTEKHSSSGHNERFAFGTSAMQGWRATMEDAHTTLPDVADAHGAAFFAVYDGHGGDSVAEYCGKHLHEFIIADAAFSKKEFRTAIHNGFLETDRTLHHELGSTSKSSGCTAITATITNENILYVGNAGDSRAVLSRDGAAIPLSIDHKPANIEEGTRILFAGGFVESGRVNGLLATSRALGDFGFKLSDASEPGEQIVIANPDITEHKLIDDDEFLVLACDGIWDCMSSKQVVGFVRQRIAERIPLDTICEMTLDHCLAKPGSLTTIGCDNMTMIIVALLNGSTIENWYESVSSRVAAVRPADLPMNRHNEAENSHSTDRKDAATPKHRLGKSVGRLTQFFSGKLRPSSAKMK